MQDTIEVKGIHTGCGDYRGRVLRARTHLVSSLAEVRIILSLATRMYSLGPSSTCRPTLTQKLSARLSLPRERSHASKPHKYTLLFVYFCHFNYQSRTPLPLFNFFPLCCFLLTFPSFTPYLYISYQLQISEFKH